MCMFECVCLCVCVRTVSERSHFSLNENEAPEIQVNAAYFFLLFFFFVLFLHKHSLVVHNYTLLSKRRLAGNRLTVF